MAFRPHAGDLSQQLTGPLERPCHVLSVSTRPEGAVPPFIRPGDILGRPQVSFLKRQREQAKREKQQMKIERRAQRANEPQTDDVENADVESGEMSDAGGEIAETVATTQDQD